MKVLSISTDRKILEEGSTVQARMIDYGMQMNEFHIVVLVPKSHKLQAISYKLSSNVFVYPTHSSSPWMYVWDAIRLGKKIIVDSKFVRGDSVVTAQDPFECGFVAWRIATAFRLPLHLQVHTDFLNPYFKTSLLQRIRVMLGKFLLPKASGIRVVSERIAESIMNSGIRIQKPLQVLPIRIDVEQLEKSVDIDLHTLFPQFKFVILMASRLTKEKRIDDALRAMQKIVGEYPWAGLLIAGEGGERKKLEQLSVQLGIADHVVFLGFQDDVFSLMKSAHVFLSTSEYEGYGMSLIEAGLAGCPIVSTHAGIAGSILKDGLNAYLCPVGDVDCVVGKVMQLISDTASREIIRGRLVSDIRATIPTKEEYIEEYVKGLQDTIEK